MSRIHQVGIGVALTALCVTQAGGATARTASATADSGGTRGYLMGVATLSARDAWAVGYSWDQSSEESGIIEHWDGSRWRSLDVDLPGRDSELLAVSAVDAEDVWAVGDYVADGRGGPLTLVEHWDGTSWQQVSAPSPGGRAGTSPYAVSAASSSDAWITGDYRGHPLFLHWDGSRWRSVTKTSLGSRLAEMTGVTSISATDAWAVGQYNGSRRQFLTMHWDGTSWDVVPSAPLRKGWQDPSMSGVSAVSSTDVWAVGMYFLKKNFSLKGFAEHWDGQKWTAVRHPNPGGDDTTGFVSVSTTSDGRAWLTGYLLRPRLPVAEHWDGTRWTNVTVPGQGFLSAVDAVSDTDAWAVGYVAGRPLFEHWDGSGWTRF